MYLKGRIVAIRNHGKVCFLDLKDESLVHKLLVSEEDLSDYSRVKKELFLGACVGLEVQRTLNARNEPIFKVIKVDLNSKPYVFPANYPKNKLKDLQLRYKKRSLDLLSNPESFEILKSRFRIISKLKHLLLTQNFVQVDTPVLEEYYGGAVAKPFTTTSGYRNKNYFLRISLEFALKKLIIGGFKNVFQIGPVFRNEDLDSTHTFQFNMLQFYTVDKSYEEVVHFIQRIYCELYQAENGTYFKDQFDLRTRWPRYTEKSLFEKLKLHDLKEVSELQSSNLLGPVYHLQNFESIPLGIAPYVIESYVDYDVELATSYQQQNDYQSLKKSCDLGNYQVQDVSFLESLKYGMLNTVGCGIGVDRLVKSLKNLKTIREGQSFPLV